MVHKMKLLERPFQNIKNGSKTVEFRLYDEKRQKLKIGDKIEFLKLPELKDKIVVEVLDLYKQKTFNELFKKLYNSKEEIEKKIKSIYTIYSPEQEQKYGIIGIKIKLDIDELIKQIKGYIPYNAQEQKDKDTMLEYINIFDDVLTRQNEFGHFTSSSWIVNKQRTKVLMIYHNIYNSWAWTGGHADGENNLLNVALKEAKEETGLSNIRPITDSIYTMEIICVNGHIKRNKYVSSHLHLNLTYLLEADENEKLKIKRDENSGVKWIDINKSIGISSEDWMKGIYKKIINKMETNYI